VPTASTASAASGPLPPAADEAAAALTKQMKQECLDWCEKHQTPMKEQKRKVPRNPPPGVKKSVMKQGARRDDVKSRTLLARAKEHTNEGLEIRAGQIWCRVCRCNVGSSSTSVRKHLATIKHSYLSCVLIANKIKSGGKTNAQIIPGVRCVVGLRRVPKNPG